MKSSRIKALSVFLFRLLSGLAILLFCDFWFYTHMTAKWQALDRNNKYYWKNYVGKEWSTTDIRAVFGNPDTITSNAMCYTAFDFARSCTVFPITEILLKLSLWHVQRHDIEFFITPEGKVNGSSDSENDGSFMKYQRFHSKQEEAEHAARLKKEESDACASGVADAERDFSNGVYHVREYGLRCSVTPADDYLKTRYNITPDVVAGCCVSREMVASSDGYNDRMTALLIAKHGRDIFKEAEKCTTPAVYDHAWVMSAGWAGYMGVAIALTSNKYYYWFYSDERSGSEPRYPISSEYQFDGRTLSLDSNTHLYSSIWVVVTNGGRICLSAPSETGDVARLLIPDGNFDPAEPFRNQRALKPVKP